MKQGIKISNTDRVCIAIERCCSKTLRALAMGAVVVMVPYILTAGFRQFKKH